jgi:hypothetical protein
MRFGHLRTECGDFLAIVRSIDLGFIFSRISLAAPIGELSLPTLRCVFFSQARMDSPPSQRLAWSAYQLPEKAV